MVQCWKHSTIALGITRIRELNVFTLTRLSKVTMGILIVLALTLAGNIPGFSGEKHETISATARGTGTQLGGSIGTTLIIYSFSTPEDRQTLIQAFQKGQNQGLVDALRKMKAVGHLAITGTIGSDCAYIRTVPTSTGRKIVFVTNRWIRTPEMRSNSQSQAYNLTAGILDINDQDKSKSSGVLYPAAQLTINSDGEPQWDLRANAWNLIDILDWK